MPTQVDLPVITCFLLKVASRCNINCDYCYMYNHVDQSWKDQPKLMSDETLQASALRISEYVISNGLKRISIVYHGGEPLLLGSKKMIGHAFDLRGLLPDVSIDFSIQTNGILLKESDLIDFQNADIQVSLSLDGPESAQNRHRLDHKGVSTFKETFAALSLLEKYPEVFAGVIAVVDINNSPKDILEFFTSKNLPQLDFLLPDANYITPPPLRQSNENIYKDWLIECFDLWFDQYSTLKIRTFDTILSSLMGSPSETDGLGLGDVSLITIETDGTYHDLDVLKITGAGTNLNQGDVYTNTLGDALISDQIKQHRRLLSKDGLSPICQACEIVEVCGGGAVGHRYSVDGYRNPSIYCNELKSLIFHVDKRISEQLKLELDAYQPQQEPLSIQTINSFEKTTGPSEAFLQILESFQESQMKKFHRAIDITENKGGITELQKVKLLSSDELRTLSIQPGLVAWSEVVIKDNSGIAVHSIDGNAIPADHFYLMTVISSTEKSNWPSVQKEDTWLRLPFGDKIFFEPSESAHEGAEVLGKAIALIQNWKPLILKEMALISPEIQFIRDVSAHEDKVVSFSDNSVPGALYVQLKVKGGFVCPEDLADSIIHEHRHQRLYLFQRVCPIVNNDFPLVQSPWREELRPPTGLFHALYVFVELLDFWGNLQNGSDKKLSEKGMKECDRISGQLKLGFDVVRNCDLTERGKILLELLHERFMFLTK